MSWRGRWTRAAEVSELARFLSPAERERARRFRANRHRDAYIVGRGRLRELLGLVVGCPPAAVRLVAGPRGKPRLDGPVGGRVRFNVAHSSVLMLCAVAVDRDVGVDVERMDETADWEEIAARSFAAAERQALAALARTAQQGAFFACWTRKEAVIKATGEGLARPLDSFVVSVEPDHAAVLSCDPALGLPASWFLASVPVPSELSRGGRRPRRRRRGLVAALVTMTPHGPVHGIPVDRAARRSNARFRTYVTRGGPLSLGPDASSPSSTAS